MHEAVPARFAGLSFRLRQRGPRILLLITICTQVQHVSDEKDMLHTVTGHPFIIALKGAFQDSRCVYIVMDFVPGGEFFTHLRDHGRCALSAGNGVPFLPKEHTAMTSAVIV